MDKKKLIILIFIVIGVLTIMMFGAGAYRSKNDRRPKDDAEPHPVAKLIGGATGWLKPEFDLTRIRECRNGSTLIVSNTCEVRIAPRGARPSSFKLKPAGGFVELCFAFSRTKLTECKLGLGEPKLRRLERESGFTVAKDSAFLFIKCTPIGNSPCQISIKKD